VSVWKVCLADDAFSDDSIDFIEIHSMRICPAADLTLIRICHLSATQSTVYDVILTR
jgi:hypothetical protein